MDVEESQCIFL